MDTKLKTKWVKALRSGRYKQGCGNLRNLDGTYCCLGVLRNVIQPGSELQAEDCGYLHSTHRNGLDRESQIALGHLNDERVPFEIIAGLIQVAL